MSIAAQIRTEKKWTREKKKIKSNKFEVRQLKSTVNYEWNREIIFSAMICSATKNK